MTPETDEQRPPAYGYMRVFSDAADHEAYALEEDMKHFADEYDLQLTAIYHEFVPGSLDAFNELVEVLRSTGAVNVILPSLRDLCENNVLQNALLDRLEFGFSAEVHALDERHDRADDALMESEQGGRASYVATTSLE
ncbi:recombinase family protein [Streptomyces scopuliridis]|uniref:recombinase family protein n=1 Tax=Streptomyces scopuliridis TaxID=452529 RepID=UPI0036ADDFD2